MTNPTPPTTAPLSPRPFQTLLIANRGEIARRIIRTARAMGLVTVAVYSEADRNSPHVHEADRAVRIGPAAARDSYLSIPALIEAARRTGAQAIHPGYGFLAENAAFAEAVEGAGLVFVGPPAHAIRAMGNKAEAKRLMLAAGMPCVPGTQDPEQGDADLAAAADRIGFPVMVKAAAGGGGRGMRLVRAAADLPGALMSARSEALAAFGSDELIIERAVLEPRHVEIQILADAHGHVIHLGERDCSVQRRHQKVIEEAPSPAVDADLRRRMGEAAVTAAKSIGYVGAGTMEFLLDRDGAFYFMEMNTRLQVEHAVTEAVTGLDLVEWQLRIAAGEPLTLTQNDIQFDGHAIEARLTAEDVPAGFLPQAGPVRLWRPPHAGRGVRVDHALASGGAVSPYYDSMVAKLVAHGRTREEARVKLLRAVEDCVVLGVATNQGFLADCLAHPAFAAGEVATDFVARHFGAAPGAGAPGTHTLAFAAMLLAGHDGDASPPLGARLNRSVIDFALGEGDGWRATITGDADGWQVALDAKSDSASCIASLRGWRVGPSDRAVGECDGLTQSAAYARDGLALHLFHAGRTWRFQSQDPRKARGVPRQDGTLAAPMSGRVVAVHVVSGDRVMAGQALVALEAMKMEHELRAPFMGRVVELEVQIGTQVMTGKRLLRVEREEEGTPT